MHRLVVLVSRFVWFRDDKRLLLVLTYFTSLTKKPRVLWFAEYGNVVSFYAEQEPLLCAPCSDGAGIPALIVVHFPKRRGKIALKSHLLRTPILSPCAVPVPWAVAERRPLTVYSHPPAGFKVTVQPAVDGADNSAVHYNFGANTSSVLLGPLLPGTSYQVHVEAYDIAVTSAASSVVYSTLSQSSGTLPEGRAVMSQQLNRSVRFSIIPPPGWQGSSFFVIFCWVCHIVVSAVALMLCACGLGCMTCRWWVWLSRWELGFSEFVQYLSTLCL